jgi:type I restriction enzyme S subunit
MTDLPPGWAWVTLDEIALSVKNGIYVSRPGSEPNGVPILRISAVRELALNLSDIRYSERTEEELAQSDALVLENDILFTRYNGNADYVGVAALVRPKTSPLTYPDKLIRVRVDERVADPRFVTYMFAAPAVRAKVREVCRTTAGQVGISGKSLRGIRFPLPPLAEQRRIVATLEDHLSRLTTSEASIRSAAHRSKGLRSRLLRDFVNENDGYSTHYTLGQLAESVRNGMYVSRPGVEPDGVPILRIGSVRALELNALDVRYSGKSAKEVADSDYLLKGGDLLFTRYNGNPEYVGACAVVPEDVGVLTYPDKLIRVRVDTSRALPEYIALACSAGDARAAIRRSVKTTAGQAGISGKELKNIPIVLPSLGHQQRIVDAFSESDRSISKLEFELVMASQSAAALRRSLLVDAFAGRLVEQDPADEPASVLLERIRAERAAQGPVRRARRGKGKTAPQEETLV